MLRASLALLILLAASGDASAARDIPDGFVGSIVPPYPAGTESYEGICVGPDGKDLCAFSLGKLFTLPREPIAVYAGKFHGRAPDGREALWLVTDAIPHPGLTDAQGFRWATCLNNGVSDGAVMAVVEDKNAARSKAAGWAYKLDYETGKLVRLDPAGIECVFEEGD
ncbi:MAG: hypothetical protein U1E87_05995 [Alphaproteobacteria bacterium]